MYQRTPGKLLQGLCLICLGLSILAMPALALPPPPPCEPGQFETGWPITATIDGPSAVDPYEQATFTATASDHDYCPSDETTPADTVDKFTWYVDGDEYTPGSNQSQITVSFTSRGNHTVSVSADDEWLYADDDPSDPQHFPKTVTVSDSDYTYDKNGNRRTMCDERGCTLYEYDDLGRLIKVTEPDGKWIAYEYDMNSNRTKMTVHLDDDPLVEHVTEYDYYYNNLLHHVTDQLAGVTTYTYKANGLVASIIYPNQTKALYTYVFEDTGGPERNWLKTISNQKSDNTIIAESTYSYSPTYWGKNGTRTQALENILLPGGSDRIQSTVSYTYDDLYRLTGEVRTGDLAYSKSYTYDAAGNRTHMVADGVHTYYGYDAANKMLTAGTASFTYDIKGNTHTETDGSTVTTYTWDIRNRMVQWEKTNQTTETYVYNADGMRVRKTPTGGTQTDFLLDFAEIAEATTGSSVTSYVGPALISKISDTTRTVYHADGIGSTRAMSDSNEAVVQAEVYDAYGNRLTTSVPAPTFGFAGQYRYYADATGLDYLKARYYDSGAGRFISQDPIGYEGGLNLYSYVDNRPLAFVDPTGQKPSPYDLLWLEACIEGCVKAILGDFPGYDNPKAIKNQIRPWCALLCAKFKACGCNGLSKYCLSIPNTNHGKWCMTFYISVCPNG